MSSIRSFIKDHASSAVGSEFLGSDTLPRPDHHDVLKFWTQHPTGTTLVNLTPLSDGRFEIPRGKWNGPFTGRPKLILQMVPAIQETFLGSSKGSIKAKVLEFQSWWRVLDAVEMAAEKVGHPMERVEDVRQLTHVHCEFAHRSGMRNGAFREFVRNANMTLRSLGAPELHWRAPEDAEPNRQLPPPDQIAALRIALKQEWQTIRGRWAWMDKIQANGFVPQTEEESVLLSNWRYFSDKQKAFGKTLPTTEELLGDFNDKSFTILSGLHLTKMRTVAFPSRWDVEIAFHLCLSSTGWNPATLFSLDTTKDFLRHHPRDENRYLLLGTKARAGGVEQPVVGLWKTKSGPGFIIKAWLDRVAPLRKQIEATLVVERQKYSQMLIGDASADDMTSQLKRIQGLEAGCRSVWLYVGRTNIDWFHAEKTGGCNLYGRQVTNFALFIHKINRERADRNELPIAPVTASDFRDAFSVYVWRSSGGNIFSVMRALNHAQLRTTSGYLNNNILNAERDQQARAFVNHLFSELGAGRVDITILAHLQRHGEVTKEMQQRLADYRSLQLSRMGVACKDPFHPPKEIQPESGGGRVCGPQRCLLCKDHAVILPESLSGVAMRVEELEAIEAAVPVETWLNSSLPLEKRNGLDVLKLFPPDDVSNVRERWAQAITNGEHRVPGLHFVGGGEKLA